MGIVYSCIFWVDTIDIEYKSDERRRIMENYEINDEMIAELKDDPNFDEFLFSANVCISRVI